MIKCDIFGKQGSVYIIVDPCPRLGSGTKKHTGCMEAYGSERKCTLAYEFVWDGKTAYGTGLKGVITVTVNSL